jgi:16S rRNA (guanine527-N7)-methyltransferase
MVGPGSTESIQQLPTASKRAGISAPRSDATPGGPDFSGRAKPDPVEGAAGQSPSVEPDQLQSDAVELEPAAAAAVFDDRIELARGYVHALATAGLVRGLIGPREAGRLWSRHVLNSAAVAQ